MNLRTSRLWTLGAALLLATTLTACGSADNDQPAVCASLESLESSVAGLTDITLNKDALAQLEDGLDEITSDLDDVKDDAGDEFSTEIDAVERASSDLRTTLDAAVATPSLQAIAAVGTPLKALGTSLRSLGDAVKSTC